MSGINRRIQINGDPPRVLLAALVALDDHLRERLRQAQQFGPAGRILKARQRRLRGQRVAGDRIATDQKLVHRIIVQSCGIVGIGIPTGYAKHPLLEEFFVLVQNLAGLPPIDKATGQPSTQSEGFVTRLEQNRTTIRARMILIELSADGALR